MNAALCKAIVLFTSQIEMTWKTIIDVLGHKQCMGDDKQIMINDHSIMSPGEIVQKIHRVFHCIGPSLNY